MAVQMMALQTREVLPILAQRGVPTRRETLAAMSDALGLRTRTSRANWAPRCWTPDQVELIVLAFRLRRGWNLDFADLKALLERGDEAVAELAGEYGSTLANFATVGRALLATEADLPGFAPDELEAVDIPSQARRGAA
jgi:hypothetical protein